MMFESLASMALCVLVILAIGLLIAPFIALHRTRRLEEILNRLRTLEHQMEMLRKAPSQFSTPIAPSEPAIAREPAVVAASVERDRPKPRRQPEPEPASGEWSALDLETFLGARGLGWAAVVLLLFAAAFFFRELFERNLIGPLGRVSIGLVFGCIACIAGYWQHRKCWRITSQMLTAAGVVLLYLSVYASFGYYKLLPSNAAGVFLVLIVAQALALAVVYEAPAIAIMAVIGGLLNPVLLHTDQDRYVSLFTYLAVLNVAVAGLLLVRRWHALSLLTIAGTNLLFWIWYEQNYHPTKLTAALVFHGSLAFVWFAQQMLGPMSRFARLDAEDAIRLFVQAFFLAAAGYVLLDERIPDWMGTLALGVAIVHTALTWLVLRRRPNDVLHAICEWTLAMGFLATVMPLQASGHWVAVCWAVQGLALWWFSLAIRSLPLRVMGFAFFALAAVRFLLRNVFEARAHQHPFWPIFNTFALSGLAIAACFVTASFLARRLKPAVDSGDFILARIVGMAGLALVWVVASAEAYDYFQTQRNINDPAVQALLRPAEIERNREDFNAFVARRDTRLAKSAQVALSTVWGLYAVGLITLGLRLPSRPLRWAALTLFGFTLLKVMILDMENLRGLYRVAALFGLSMMMGVAAWGYQKVKLSLLVEEEDRHASPI